MYNTPFLIGAYGGSENNWLLAADLFSINFIFLWDGVLNQQTERQIL
jgi:hypothetical protein